MNTGVAVGLTLMATFSPCTGVWSSPSTALLLGFAGPMVSGVLSSLRARPLLARILWALVAAWAVVAVVVVIYPQWMVSVGLAVLTLVVGLIMDSRWVADPAATQAKLIRLAPDALDVRVNSSGKSGALLAPDLLLFDQPLVNYSCLASQGTIPLERDRPDNVRRWGRPAIPWGYAPPQVVWADYS